MPSWEQLAVQIPLVAAIIWFVLEMDRRNAMYAEKRDAQWRNFLSQQSVAYTKSLRDITESIGKLTGRLDAHDQFVQTSIARMEGVVEKNNFIFTDQDDVPVKNGPRKSRKNGI